jgi:glycosyltransferase involved in cell wall biosynthesis
LPNLRILFLATRDWKNPGLAGGDKAMSEYARYLSHAGHKVTFVASRFAGSPTRETVDGVEVVRLRGLLSLWLLTFLFYLRSGRSKYDVVVAEGFGGSRIPRLTPLYVREPIITEWHQIHRDIFAAQYPRLFVPILNLLERVTAHIHRNTLIRVATADWQAAFPRLGFRKENIALVPVGIPEDWLDGDDIAQVRKPNVLWLGKFRRYKCPHHLVLAMPGVLKEVPNAHLLLAGRHDDKRYEAYLRRLVSELGLDRSVNFEFDVAEEKKKDLITKSRVLALPSSVEGFGLVVLEANACGVPVVASSGVPYGAVRDGENGLRYQFGDIEGLTKALIVMLVDNTRHDVMSANAKRFASAFGWRTAGAQFEQLVERAAHRSHI